MPEDEADAVERAYGDHFARLAALKARYDPDNLLRMNQNIAPAG
jgi:FAD/FMN-containing dehydrogenase